MANFNFNKVIIGGRLTSDPELKTTPSGISVTSFTIAVNRRFGSKNGEDAQADFINVTAWRQTAEFVARYFNKGKPILICGQLQTRSWTDQNGQKHYATEVVAEEAAFVENFKTPNARPTSIPRTMSATRRILRGDEGIFLALAKYRLLRASFFLSAAIFFLAPIILFYLIQFLNTCLFFTVT